MPVRPRRHRRPRHGLTMERDLTLSIGPRPGLPSSPPQVRPGSPEWEALSEVFERHRDSYGPGSWGHKVFVEGDIEGALAMNRLTPAE